MKWKSIRGGLLAIVLELLSSIWTSYSGNGIPVADGLLFMSAVWRLFAGFRIKNVGKYLVAWEAGGCGSGVGSIILQGLASISWFYRCELPAVYRHH